MVLPGLPTTIFLILALGCFKKGSKRFEDWLLNHKWFGAQLRDWEENRWMTKAAKCKVSCIITVFAGGSAVYLFMTGRPIIGSLVSAVGLIGILYVLNVKIKPDSAESSGAVAETPIRPATHR